MTLVFSRSMDIITLIVVSFFNLTLLHSLIPLKNVYFSFNSVSWFLSTLLICYLFSPEIHTRIKHLSQKRLFYLIVAIMFVQFSYVLVFRDSSVAHWSIYINPFYRLSDFILGVIIGEVSNRNNLSYKATTVEILIVLLLVLLCALVPLIPEEFLYNIYWEPILMLLIYVFSYENGKISEIIIKSKINYLGQYVFCFFLGHQIVIRYCKKFLYGSIPAVVLGILMFIISIIFANILYKLNKINYMRR